MEPLTSAWTERHTWVAALVAVVALATTAGVLEDPPVGAWVAVAVVVAAAMSLVLDALGGLAAGFVVAALLVAARRLGGVWEADGFVLALVETAAIVCAAVVAGRVGTSLRPSHDEDDDAAQPLVEPVFGSLGLLDADTAMLRLEEEVERAQAHGRPLTLAVLRIDVHDQALDAAGRTAAQRAVARLLESRVRDTDVPFALTRDKLAVILPETAGSAALERVAAVLDGVATGRFASRSEGADRALADAVDVQVGTAGLGDATASADALLDAATAALERADTTGGAP